MLSIIATNFGVNPSDIQIKEYHEQNLLVLEGDIPVDTTAAEYAGIRPMKLTVADLPFAKSRIGTALVTAASISSFMILLTSLKYSVVFSSISG